MKRVFVIRDSSFHTLRSKVNHDLIIQGGFWFSQRASGFRKLTKLKDNPSSMTKNRVIQLLSHSSGEPRQ